MTDIQAPNPDDMPGQDYFRWFYDNAVWKRMHYRGVRILKVPSDLWNYQEIFVEHGIKWVVETGTRHGGSALFFSIGPTFRLGIPLCAGALSFLRSTGNHCNYVIGKKTTMALSRCVGLVPMIRM